MIFCVSASYKKTSLPMLESLMFKSEDEAMKDIYSEGHVRECIILQTCHRVEIYCVTQDSAREAAISRILRFWSTKVGVSIDILGKTIELYQERAALEHLFFLAAGLESMVVGEDQILGQVRNAYVKAKKLRTAGMTLDSVFMKAVNVGRRVRTETKTNEGSVSISSVAVDLAAKELRGIKSKKALVIGAGETGSLAAETLKRKGAKKILIANRTYEKGAELASKVSGEAIRFDRIFEVMPEVDLTIVAISIKKPLIRREQMKKALAKRILPKSLYMIDLSQPRAIDEKVGLLQRAVLRNIDDLKEIVEENIRNRQVEAEKARKMVLEELERFEHQLSELVVEPLISEIYRKIEDLRSKELERAMHKMGEFDNKRLAIMDRFSRELIERIMQSPVEELREAALGNNDSLLSAAEKLFRVNREKGEKVV
jgi:glutamyl-tRNA reductase